jgi:hypothetical protein
MIRFFLAAIVVLLSVSWIASSQEQQTNMTFFVTSVGSGKGADLGGMEGADRHCQSLAQAVGAGNRTWRAYLSASAADGKPAINARDRIGRGPWRNAKGVVIAKDIDELHGNNNLNRQTALSEKGIPLTPEATNRICTIFSLAHGRTGERFQERRIGLAATGQAARKAPRWLATTTGRDCAMTNHPGRGIRHIHPGDAARKLCVVRVEMVYSIASRWIKRFAAVSA